MRIAITAAAALVVAAALRPVAVGAQEREDTLPPPPDTAVVAAPDTVETGEGADTVPVTPDSLRFHTLPDLVSGPPAAFETGVWVWERPDLMAARAQTLLELLEDVPGVVALRGGDYGTPEIFSVFGLGGGRVRVYLDGFEMLPLDGSVPDLARIALAGAESVRVERGMGEVRIEIESLQAHDPRPMSIVEAGTGDFDTNHFRGTFLHPRALGGSLALSLERIDTRGPEGEEEGARQGAWLRYTYHLGDRGGIRAEYRRGSAETVLDSLFPTKVTRSDWIVRGRYELAPRLVVEAYTGSSGVSGPDDGLTPIDADRAQHGVRASWERGPVWARGAFRLMSGPDLPSSSVELEAGGFVEGLGGAAARLSRDSWDGEGALLTGVRAWTRPVFGLSGFASYESGERGARIFQPREVVPEPEPDTGQGGEEPEEEPVPTHRITDRTGLRVGASFDWGPLDVSGAWLRAETDSLVPFGLHTDREGLAIYGGEHTGFEVSGRLALPLDGFTLYGALQQWDQETRYLPERTYQGGIAFHDVFLESGNFELWADVGVQGRDPMVVPLLDEEASDVEEGFVVLERVPFQQRWNALIEARILTLHLLIRWDNFTVRRNNQDFPGRVQPITRATYGIRWTLWN